MPFNELLYVKCIGDIFVECLAFFLVWLLLFGDIYLRALKVRNSQSWSTGANRKSQQYMELANLPNYRRTKAFFLGFLSKSIKRKPSFQIVWLLYCCQIDYLSPLYHTYVGRKEIFVKLFDYNQPNSCAFVKEFSHTKQIKSQVSPCALRKIIQKFETTGKLSILPDRERKRIHSSLLTSKMELP